MKCMFIVLNKTDKLDELLSTLADNGINGATILESTGMAHKLLSDDYSTRFLGSLRNVLNNDREKNTTIFMVLSDEQVLLARVAVKKVLKNISKPDTGILFTVPVDFVEGVNNL